MITRLPWFGLAVAAWLVSGCADYEPGVKVIEDLGPYMKKNVSDCAMLPKNFGEEANKDSEALMKLPTRYADSFKDDVASLKEKFGSRLEEPCEEIIKGAKACRLDGAPNISGFGQGVIDICKEVEGIDKKL